MTGHRRLWQGGPYLSLCINVCLCFEGGRSNVLGVFQKVSSVLGVFDEKTNPPGGSEFPEAQLYPVQENFAR